MFDLFLICGVSRHCFFNLCYQLMLRLIYSDLWCQLIYLIYSDLWCQLIYLIYSDLWCQFIYLIYSDLWCQLMLFDLL